MKPCDRVVSFPPIGTIYTDIIYDCLNTFGLNVVQPPPITDKTIKLGVNHSPDMMCFPYKVTLGSMIELVDLGVNTILMYSTGSAGMCRQRLYWKLQQHQINRLGHEVEIFPVNFKNILWVLSKISGKSIFETYGLVKRAIRSVYVLDKPKKLDGINIGIIGEIYCCCDETINYGLEDKIRKYGANPYNPINIANFIHEQSLLKIIRSPIKKYMKKADAYIRGRFGGHAKQNLAYLFQMIDDGIDGIIHLLPLSCMPETTIEPFVDAICEDVGIPVLRITIDENNSEANLNTRVETFIKLLRWNSDKCS